MTNITSYECAELIVLVDRISDVYKKKCKATRILKWLAFIKKDLEVRAKLAKQQEMG